MAFAQEIPRLQVSDNKHYLVTDAGAPFFWLGDTAWELFHRLSREETELYLENRRQKGFTVIQAVALAELDGLHTPNFYGDLPLINDNPTRPDTTSGSDVNDSEQYDYWDHVEWVIDVAAEKGIFIALLPTWGDKVVVKWGVGPVIFNEQTAAAYGQWIGQRFGMKKNIIWILGGDRNAVDDKDYRPIWRAMAAAIKSQAPHHLMSYHPGGAVSSSTWFQSDDWFDFSMIQSSHSSKEIINYTYVQSDYKRSPNKPVLDGEPAYEDHPVNWDPNNGWFDDADVRHGAYLAMFAGAFGHTYGCHDIWQMFSPGRSPISSARTYWYNALDLPGAFDLAILRRLLESRPLLDRVPDQSLLSVRSQGSGRKRIQILRSADDALIYFATGTTVTIKLGILSGTTLRSWWLNPSSGDTLIGSTLNNSGAVDISCPDTVNDWVLILENAAVYHTKVGDKRPHPVDELMLYGNFPNPFNHQTTICYELFSPGLVELRIFNLVGQCVCGLREFRTHTGRNTFHVDGDNLPSGCYIYIIQSGKTEKFGKLALVR